MRTIITLALASVLVAGAGSALAEDRPSTPDSSAAIGLLGVSPSPEPIASPQASTDPGASPSLDPCTSPAPLPSPDPAAGSFPPAADPSAVPAADPSAVPASPAQSAAPSIDPCASPEPSPAATDEPTTGFQPNRVRLDLVQVADGLAQPVFLTGTGDASGSLLIVEREGRIRILTPNGRLRSFLDIRSRVDTLNERGLHAVALHPNHARNGRFYVNYNSPDGATNIVEFTGKVDGGRVRTGTARTILRVSQPFENHNGGWIGFGPDGMLYIALGDGGGNSPGDPLNNGQRRSTLLAKILRIDVDGRGRYGIPSDNPYPRGQRGFAPETFVWGLRNPWRASFDRLTGDLWIGDVGQDTTEEIDLVPAGRSGLNFGWSEMEGSRCHQGSCDPSDYVLPVTEYTHGADGCSVNGGYVYRGEAQPLLTGAYLFSDFCSGKIWALRADDAKAGAGLRARQLFQTGSSTWVGFGEDDAGELYAISLGGGIYRIEAKRRGG